ncbi:hypothetical protein LWI29_018610 [Acer saccharum]|uniref:Uncharacterized protein n=1 Tax=Acer saccharum TaxID=4024 RepID=A0AA39VPS1_ACESA|nr:hypothetical protein LWI29_018610 [Acer saccharum]
MSLFDFSATEICSYLVNNDIYIGDSWGHVKDKSCNRKMEFFFNCHSLSFREIKCLHEQASVLLAEKLSAEESHAQQLAQFRESSDGHLSARLAVEEKPLLLKRDSLAEGASVFELRVLRSTFGGRAVAEEAKEKAEHEAADLRN